MAKLGISTGTTPDDGTGDSLLNGAVKINSNFNEIYSYFGDGTNLNFSRGFWQSTAVGINTLTNVGIGTTNPRFSLEVGAVGASGTSLYVNGDARITGILTVGTSSIILDGFANKIRVGSGVTIDGNTGIISATSIIVDGTTISGAGVTYITAGSGIFVNQNTGNVTITAGIDTLGTSTFSNINATGVVTAASFVGDGSGLTNLPSGGALGLYWAQNSTGIHTLSNIGIGTTTSSSALTVQGNVNVTGISTLNTLNVLSTTTFQEDVHFGDNDILSFGDGDYLLIYHNGANSIIKDSGVGSLIISGSTNIDLTNPLGSEYYARFNVDGSAELYYDNSKKFETTSDGVTISGSVLTDQLSVSGISTFSGRIDPSSSGILFDGGTYTGSDTPLKLWIGTNAGSRYFTLTRSNVGSVTFDNDHPTGTNNYVAADHAFSQTGSDYYAYFTSGSVRLYHPATASGILDQKFETTSTGVAVVGIVTASSASGIVTYYGDVSNAVDGRWVLGANGTSDYTFTGIGFTQTSNDPILYLARGRVYEFVNNSGGGHPFQIRVSDGGASYDDGVTNNSASSGIIRFEVPFNAPNTLYYQCTVHSGMGNTISVYPNLLT